MHDKDISEKHFLDIADVFADIINGLVFKGKQVIKPNDLMDALPRSMIKADGHLHEQERDCCKFWTRSVQGVPVPIRICLFGVENQTFIDRTISVRVLSYDGDSYKAQMIHNDSIRRKNKALADAGKPPLEETEQEYPVITIVLYFGKKPWNKALSVREYYADQIKGLPRQLRPLVNNYRAKVFDISHLSPEQIEYFHTDFRYVAGWFAANARGEHYTSPDNKPIIYVDAFLKLMGALSHDNRFIVQMEEHRKNGKEPLTMTELIDRIENYGANKARKKLADQLMELAQKKGCAALVADLISEAEEAYPQGS